MEDIMRKRIAEAAAQYDACWDSGRGSHHPDYDPSSERERKLEEEENGGVDISSSSSSSSSSSRSSSLWRRADRPTEELYAAIVADDLPAVYRKLEEGADPNFEFGLSYRSKEGYTPLMVAAHRGRLEAAKALLRAGADPNHVNRAGDAALFWAVDGGAEMISLFVEYGADLDRASPKGWTALQYARAKGKYGAPEEKGVYPEVSEGGEGGEREREGERERREREEGQEKEEAFFSFRDTKEKKVSVGGMAVSFLSFSHLFFFLSLFLFSLYFTSFFLCSSSSLQSGRPQVLRRHGVRLRPARPGLALPSRVLRPARREVPARARHLRPAAAPPVIIFSFFLLLF